MSETGPETAQQDRGDETPDVGTSGIPEPQNGSESDQEPKGNREARYRVERNEARTERDALAETLTALQTRELHRLAGEHLANPEDIDLAGNDLSFYLTPEGWVDTDAVAEAAESVLSSRPGLSRNSPAFDPTQGHGSPTPKHQLGWGDLFKT